MTLDPVQLKRDAMAQTGLSHFGNAPMDEGLERFTSSLIHEARLTGKQLAAARGTIVATLIQRLKIEDFLATHPEIDRKSVV